MVYSLNDTKSQRERGGDQPKLMPKVAAPKTSSTTLDYFSAGAPPTTPLQTSPSPTEQSGLVGYIVDSPATATDMCLIEHLAGSPHEAPRGFATIETEAAHKRTL
jgi:hypothetical protein